MQASTVSVKGSIFGANNQKGLVGFGDFRNGSVLRPRRVCMTKKSNFCGSRIGSVSVESELSSARVGFGGIFMNSAKSRPIRVQASGLLAISDYFLILCSLSVVFWIFWTLFDDV
jgi:hypothetical protein